LGDSQADVRKFTVGVPGKWAWTADAEMLERELRSGASRLVSELALLLRTMPRRFDLRIVLLGFHEQLREWRDHSVCDDADSCGKARPAKITESKITKYLDEELRTTNAQRNFVSLSKTSFSPERGQRNRRLSASHP